jgi:TonB family protein
MKLNRIAGFMVVAVLTVATGHAQTAAELMQKGIFTQETSGDLDGAIAIFRQIVNSGSSPRDLAAQAQYRIAQSLLQKGDLAHAAQEFDNLARNYADYGSLVSNLAATGRPARTLIGVFGGRGGPAASGNSTLDQQSADRQKELALAIPFRINPREDTGPAATSATPPGTIRVGGNVQAANLLSQTPTAYPALAKAARVQGTVRFEATIGKDGRVENLQLVSGPPLLVQAAMESVRQWTYKPTLLNGQPVSVITTVDVNFTLTE